MMFPHRLTHKRPTSTRSATWGEVVAAATEIETDVPALISPGGTNELDAPYGPIEFIMDKVFVQGVDEYGNTRVVQRRDLLIDQDTDDVWVAQGPGNIFRNPASFREGSAGTKHHIEVSVQRSDPESGVID